MIDKDNLLDLIVAKIQESIDIGTDNFCNNHFIFNDFQFENPSLDFFANHIDLIQP